MKKILAKEILLAFSISVIIFVIYFTGESFKDNVGPPKITWTVKLKAMPPPPKDAVVSKEKVKFTPPADAIVSAIAKPKFDPDKPFEVVDMQGQYLREQQRIKDYNLSIVHLNQIRAENIVADKKREIGDFYRMIILIIIVIAYPARVLFYILRWSIKTVKTNPQP